MKIESSRYVRIAAREPWGISFPSRHLARLLLISSGSCWLTSAALDEPLHLTANDCFLVRAGMRFALADQRGRVLADCESLTVQDPGGRVQTGGAGPTTEIVSSRLSFDAVTADTLFGLLPPLFRLNLDATSGQLLRTTFDLIARESTANGIGAGFVTSRLSDVLFVQALRACCTEAGGGSVGWLAALRDPQLATAVHALHVDIAHPWTIGALAHTARMSRSSFAARFKQVTGDTPMGYLTAWRMYRVKALLRDTPLSIQEIAVQVGYHTSTALSRAFLRREGIAPGAWRQLSGSNTTSPLADTHL